MVEAIKKNVEIKRLQGVLGRYCLTLTKSRWEAEDLAQETWLKALDSLQPLDHINPEAYLMRIARNAWIDRIRKQSSNARMMKAVQESMEVQTVPDNSRIGTELAMQAIMTYLSPLQQAVFLLRDVCGYSSAETAIRLGLTVGAVKAALHRARTALPAVRKAIDGGTLKASKDEGLLDVLRSLAIAYEVGDTEAMLALVQQGEMEPASAIAVLQSRRLRASGTATRRSSSSPLMSLAA
ncbi:RNA polymerase sigma factor [Paenibacillus sp. YAF4_2]|uniref:RNA polymerase sigma factor n=1 Tax=Paenibacillus sp. YAF4_2 TaxID=3233085 RepID=UPI003F967212